MKKQFLIILLIFAGLPSFILSQGITHSHGIGAKFSLWNITGQETHFNVSSSNGNTAVQIGGVGGYLFFFSRISDKMYGELSAGSVGDIKVTEDAFAQNSDVNVSSISSLLFGLRYDLLSGKTTSKFQPYVNAGVGPYWLSDVNVQVINGNETNNVSTALKYGGYTGCGTNLLITDRLALNFDLRYHFLNYKQETDYSGLEFGMGVSFMWGKKKEMFRVEGIRTVVKDIYPAYYQFYNTYPLAFVTVRNTASYPIEVNVISRINKFSERVHESGFKRIERRETLDIPIYAILGRKLLKATSREPAVIDLRIEGRAGNTLTKSLSVNIMIHSRNSWNGDMDKLVFFVTPDDEDILRFSRQIEKHEKISETENIKSFSMAKAVFEELKSTGLHYLSDPNIPYYQDDRVQFASETLETGTGDCDDLVVLYASLLESIGINTAFIEVKDPEKKIAHLYLMFNSGLSPDEGYKISRNEKKYIIRTQGKDQRNIWIPVETTLVEEGFDNAWQIGATSYLQEAVLRSGLAKGWVRILDVE